jgi:hypothetical protein
MKMLPPRAPNRPPLPARGPSAEAGQLLTIRPKAAVLIVSARVAAHPGWADGLLVVRPGQDGPISDLTVFLRPLTALQALAEEMGRRMGGPRPGGAA